MPLINLKLPNMAQFLSSATVSSSPLNQNDDILYATCYANKTDVITHVGFNVSAKSGSPPTFRYGIQGQSTPRIPDSIWKGAGSGGYGQITNPSLGWQWLELSGYVPVTGGTPLTVVIKYNNGTLNSANSLFIGGNLTLTNTFLSPFRSINNSGTITNSTTLPCIAFKYQDGSVGPYGVMPYSGVSTVTYNSGSIQLYRGNGWIPSMDVSCIGIAVSHRAPDACNFNVKVFVNNDALPVRSEAIDPDSGLSAENGVRIAYYHFPTLVLSSGNLYRFVLQPTTSTSMTTFLQHEVPDLVSLQACCGDLFGTTAQSGSPLVWVNHTGGPGGFRYYQVIPIINQVLIGYTGAFTHNRSYAL